MKKLLGIVLPTNSPDVMKKYLLSSLDNVRFAKDYIKFLINFQPPWTEEDIQKTVQSFTDKGLEVQYIFHKRYEVKGKGLVPVNQIREDTARLDYDCKYFLIFDDDMTFMGPSSKMPRDAGQQIVESLIYLLSNPDCGVLVFGGTLIKKIKRDSISPIDYRREYVTGKGIIFKNHCPEGGLFIPNSAYAMLGSDEEKVAAAYRIASGMYVAEMPFVRINHYENQLSSRNKNGKIPGKVQYEWNTDEIKDRNNFGFIRTFYSPEYVSGSGLVVSQKLYESSGGKSVQELLSRKSTVMDFSEKSPEDLIREIETIIIEREEL